LESLFHGLSLANNKRRRKESQTHEELLIKLLSEISNVRILFVSLLVAKNNPTAIQLSCTIQFFDTTVS